MATGDAAAVYRYMREVGDKARADGKEVEIVTLDQVLYGAGIKGHSMASLDALGALATRYKLREQAGLRLRALVFDVEGRRG